MCRASLITESYVQYRTTIMKKSISLLLLTGLLATSAAANPIDRAAAARIAAQRLQGTPVQVSLSTEVKGRMPSLTAADPAFYLFNNGPAEGFAIVSGDDVFPAIIGYSDEGRLDAADLPDALVAFLNRFADYMTKVRLGETGGPLRASSTDGTPVVAPLLTTKWSQEDPFNLLCPLENGTRCVVGCVATAMSQIMYHWKWPQTGRGQKSYDSGQGYLSVDFTQSTYDWANMKATAMANSKSTTSKNAVAKLCYDCGVASAMAYSTSGSGAMIQQGYVGLYTYLGYASSRMQFLLRNCWDSSQERWNAIIYDQLDKGQPIMYGGYTSTGGGQDAGHCFVLDGYDSNGYVHVNWGWGGSADGYYAIITLDPDDTSYTFSDDQQMVYNIIPDYDGTDYDSKSFPMMMQTPLSTNKSSVVLGNNFQTVVQNIYNYSGVAAVYNFAVALCDADGNFIRQIQADRSEYSNISLKAYYGYSEISLLCTMPADLADGTYAVRFMTNENGNSDWDWPNTVGGQANNWVTATVANGTVTFVQGSTPVTAVTSGRAGIVTRRFFDLSGRELAAPASGRLYIERQTLSDGTTRSLKRMAR